MTRLLIIDLDAVPAEFRPAAGFAAAECRGVDTLAKALEDWLATR